MVQHSIIILTFNFIEVVVCNLQSYEFYYAPPIFIGGPNFSTASASVSTGGLEAVQLANRL
jgi:hypothetical protein